MIQSDTSGTQPAGGTTIATWFVADDAATATFFPQVGSRSDAPETQAVYWRCVLCFYASSLVLNPAQPHVFFTNTALPTIDGIDFAAVLVKEGRGGSPADHLSPAQGGGRDVGQPILYLRYSGLS
jgi:hypothetical protein